MILRYWFSWYPPCTLPRQASHAHIFLNMRTHDGQKCSHRTLHTMNNTCSYVILCSFLQSCCVCISVKLLFWPQVIPTSQHTHTHTHGHLKKLIWVHLLTHITQGGCLWALEKKKSFNKIYKQFNELIMVLSKGTFSHARTAVTGQNSPYMIPFCYSLPSNRD